MAAQEASSNPTDDGGRIPDSSVDGGAGTGDAGKIVDALKGMADQEFNIADRLSSKARQAFVLAAGVFTVSQTVAFGTFDLKNVSNTEKHWLIGLGIVAVGALLVAGLSTLRADSTFPSRDLPLDRLEDELNAAYRGDKDVIGRLGGLYLGVVRTRRESNQRRGSWYRKARLAALLSLIATFSELIFSLISRTN